MSDELFDFGFTSGEEVREDMAVDGRAEQMFTAINTFLENLKRNPKALTIKWPDRLTEIEQFQVGLRAILAGEGKDVPKGTTTQNIDS